jgi:8-oxo-dGTP pyrophosphatase MutT (NUDIX family)
MTAVWESPDLPERLAADVAAASADPRWRRELAPELSYGRHAGPARADARLAAVAMVLCWDGLQWALPLTVRSSTLTRHGGQVSLPGGLVDADEDSRDAAQRELAEELRCQPELTWLGDLAPLFVFASNSLVTPCIAAVREWPAWEPHPPEVERVLKLPLCDLVQHPPASPLAIERGLLQFNAPRFIVDGLSVWGATAVLLGELRGRLRRC